MTYIKTAAAVIAAATLSATAASAATVGASETTGGATLAFGQEVPSGNEISFSFAWDSAPATGLVNFSAESTFDLFFTDYLPSVGDDRSGFFLKGPNGYQTTRVAGNADACDDAQFTGSDNEDISCNFIAGVDSTRNFALKPDSDNPVFANLAKGDYFIGFYEQGKPAEGSAGFRMIETEVSAVPVPASALLLGTALLGAGALTRRRRKAA